MKDKEFSDYAPGEQPLNLASIGKSEADRAAELKGRAAKLMIEFCGVMDEALREGLSIRFAGVGLNPLTGRHEVNDLHVVKRF